MELSLKKSLIPEMPKISSLKIFCFTYNLSGQSLGEKDIKYIFLSHKSQDFDIYVISTQESQRPIFWNIFYYDKSIFEEELDKYFGTQYIRKDTITLGGIHLIIYIKKIHEGFIHHYSTNFLKTGVYGLLGNKGAVSICFRIYNLWMLFICCHLCPGTNNVMYRNDDFDYINKTINPFIDKINVVIWMGDFNYRVEKDLDEVIEMYKYKHEMSLLNYDQMTEQIKLGNLKASEYKEGKINFPPTYKYEANCKGKLNWEGEDHVPSWTDRILYKSYDENNMNNDQHGRKFKLNLLEYNSIQKLYYSDHKPVYAYFEIKFL